MGDGLVHGMDQGVSGLTARVQLRLEEGDESNSQTRLRKEVNKPRLESIAENTAS